MAERKKKSNYSSSLPDDKSKRLESALSSYSPDETKKAVGKLLEAYIDDGGKNYFGAERRDTTLYFADDDYIKEVKKTKSSDKDSYKKKKPEVKVGSKHETNHSKSSKNKDVMESTKNFEGSFENEPTIIISPVSVDEDNSDTNSSEAKATNNNNTDYAPSELTEDANNSNSELTDDSSVSNDVGANAKEEEASQMKENNHDDLENNNYEAFSTEDENSYLDSSDNDDFDNDDSGFFSKFKKKKNEDEFEEFFDDDDYDDDEYDEYDDDDDDDYYYDDDDDDDDDDFFGKRNTVPVKKIFLTILIIVLICSIAILSALCFSYKNKYDAAQAQLSAYQGDGNSPTDQIKQLQTRVDELTAENESLRDSTGIVASSSSETSATSSDDETSAGSSDNNNNQSDNDNDVTPSASTYIVQNGDIGATITRNAYGEYTPELWQKIQDANPGSRYMVGEEINIP